MNHSLPKSLRWFALAMTLALLALSCSNWSSTLRTTECDPTGADEQTQADYGTAKVTVISVAPWRSVAHKLFPLFELTGSKALQVVDGAARIENQQSLELWRATAGISTKGAGPAEASTPDAAVPQLFPGDAGLPMLAHDAHSRYQQALALFQEVQLLNEYLRFVVADENASAYLVTLDVTLLPRRNAPVDAQIDISFVSFLLGFSRPESVRVVPIIASDIHELNQSNNASTNSTQLGIAIQALLASGKANASLERKWELTKQLFGFDKNSLQAVASTGRSSISVRLGASLSVNDGDGLVLVPQSRQIHCLVIVDARAVDDFQRALTAVSVNSQLIDLQLTRAGNLEMAVRTNLELLKKSTRARLGNAQARTQALQQVVSQPPQFLQLQLAGSDQVERLKESSDKIRRSAMEVLDAGGAQQDARAIEVLRDQDELTLGFLRTTLPQEEESISARITALQKRSEVETQAAFDGSKRLLGDTARFMAQYKPCQDLQSDTLDKFMRALDRRDRDALTVAVGGRSRFNCHCESLDGKKCTPQIDQAYEEEMRSPIAGMEATLELRDAAFTSIPAPKAVLANKASLRALAGSFGIKEVEAVEINDTWLEPSREKLASTQQELETAAALIRRLGSSVTQDLQTMVIAEVKFTSAVQPPVMIPPAPSNDLETKLSCALRGIGVDAGADEVLPLFTAVSRGSWADFYSSYDSLRGVVGAGSQVVDDVFWLRRQRAWSAVQRIVASAPLSTTSLKLPRNGPAVSDGDHDSLAAFYTGKSDDPRLTIRVRGELYSSGLGCWVLSGADAVSTPPLATRFLGLDELEIDFPTDMVSVTPSVPEGLHLRYACGVPAKFPISVRGVPPKPSGASQPAEALASPAKEPEKPAEEKPNAGGAR